MGASTDSVDKEWSELYTTITSGNSTATEALDAINAKLGETAAQAEKAGKAVDGNQTRIKNTGATAGAAGKAK
jgi:hypothetical protein